jgi:hypothetical protein
MLRSRAWILRLALAAALMPACAPAAPAAPVSELDSVRLILKARKLLTTADVVCGDRLVLASNEAMLLGLMRKNVKFLVDPTQFHAIERELSVEMAEEARDPAFCAHAHATKVMLLMRVRQSARSLGMDTLGL